MSFFKDMLAVFKKRELPFIESIQESEDVYSFLFEKQPDLAWKPGQYGLFSIAHKAVKNGTKPFSIASAPAENVVRITTRIGESPSDYKKAMLELKPGMKIKMSGPVGGFHLDGATGPALFIAGGIGITPYRAILKDLAGAGNGKGGHIRLLYMDSKKNYLYQNELDDLAARTSAQIAYLDSREALEREIDAFMAQHKSSGTYYVAGPKPFVDAIVNGLKNKNIAKSNIKKDAFFGYS